MPFSETDLVNWVKWGSYAASEGVENEKKFQTEIFTGKMECDDFILC